MLEPAGCAFMRKLQGSDATCCTTRRAETSPTEAVNWAAPSCLPEAALIHATPFLLVTGREMLFFPLTPSWKLTGVGVVIRLSLRSSTNTTPLITSGYATGT